MENQIKLQREKFLRDLKSIGVRRKKTITLPLFVWRRLEKELEMCMQFVPDRMEEYSEDYTQSENIELRMSAKSLLESDIELEYSYNLLKQKLKDVL